MEFGDGVSATTAVSFRLLCIYAYVCIFVSIYGILGILLSEMVVGCWTCLVGTQSRKLHFFKAKWLVSAGDALYPWPRRSAVGTYLTAMASSSFLLRPMIKKKKKKTKEEEGKKKVQFLERSTGARSTVAKLKARLLEPRFSRSAIYFGENCWRERERVDCRCYVLIQLHESI